MNCRYHLTFKSRLKTEKPKKLAKISFNVKILECDWLLLYALNEETYFNNNKIFCLPTSFTISKTISGELPYGYKTLVRKFDFSKICQEQSEWVIDICVNKPLLPLCNTTIASQNSDYIVIHTVAIWTLFFTGIVKLSSFCRLFQRVELFELRFVPKMQHKYINLYEVHI